MWKLTLCFAVVAVCSIGLTQAAGRLDALFNGKLDHSWSYSSFIQSFIEPFVFFLLDILSWIRFNLSSSIIGSSITSGIRVGWTRARFFANSSYHYHYYLLIFHIGYDKRVRPNFGGQPVKVITQIFTERMDVRDRDLDMSLTIYLRWNIKVNWQIIS